MSMDHKAADLLSGSTWHHFCDRLKRAGDLILGEEFPHDQLGRTEGFRALTGLLTHALGAELESGNAKYPQMRRYLELATQWGAPNPDNTYFRAPIHPDYGYRVWGNLSAVRQAILSLHDGDMAMDQFGVYSETSLDKLSISPDGNVEIFITREPRGGNWMPMHESARIFQVRFYVSDWERDAAPALHIERLGAEGEPPPPLDAAALGEALEKTAEWVERSVTYWNRYSAEALPTGNYNEIVPARLMPGGADNILYGYCQWDLKEDEALVLVTEPPDAMYWNFCNYSLHWLESRDVPARQVSLSGHQVHVDDDGMVRLVLSASDPGVPNWMDTLSHPRGLFIFRWVWTKTNPVPQAELSTLRDLRSRMPTGHPIISAQARCQQLSNRREQYWNRFL